MIRIKRFYRKMKAERQRKIELMAKLEALTDNTLIDRMYRHEFEQR